LIGGGVFVLRGYLPFFWDATLIGAFGVVILVNTGLLAFRHLAQYQKILIILSSIICGLIVIFSIKRSSWIIISLGLLLVSYFAFVYGNRRSIVQVLTATILGGVLIWVIISYTPLLKRQTVNVYKYLMLTNLLSEEARMAQPTKVHIDNILNYIMVLKEHPLYILTGYRTSTWGLISDIQSRYGVAHHGLIRPLIQFGLPGLVFYLFLFLAFFKYCLTNFTNLASDEKGVIIGFFSYILSMFAIKIILGTPFYISFKGSFLIFFGMALVLVVIKGSVRTRFTYDKGWSG